MAVLRNRHLEKTGSLSPPTRTPAAAVSVTVHSVKVPRETPPTEMPSPAVLVTVHRRTTGSAPR